MRYLYVLAILWLALPGCIGAQKYGQYVTKYAREQLDTSHYQTKGVLKVNSDIADSVTPAIAHTTEGRSYFIPAILYWGIMESYNCELNQRLPVNIFKKTCDEMIDPEFFSGKFKDDSLDLTITSLPTKFRYSDKGYSVVMIFFVFHLYVQAMIPTPDNLSVSYKLHRNGVLDKQGYISVKNWDKPLINNRASTKKITKLYLAQYKTQMHELSAKCLQQLGEELKAPK